MDPEPDLDPELSEKSDPEPDPEIIFLAPTHCLQGSGGKIKILENKDVL